MWCVADKLLVSFFEVQYIDQKSSHFQQNLTRSVWSEKDFLLSPRADWMRSLLGSHPLRAVAGHVSEAKTVGKNRTLT